MIKANREIYYEDFVKYIEHKTGKVVKSWKKNVYSFSRTIIFIDNTCITLNEGQAFPIKLEYQRIPESICMSCGEDSHCGIIDSSGRCEITIKKFWNKVRKVYWHRYLKNK